MSSVRVSVSGQRALTTTTNGPDATSAQMPTKGDDNVSALISSVTALSMLIPVDATIERVSKGGSQYIRLSVPNERVTSLHVFAVKPETKEGDPLVGGWPHVNVDLGKHIRDPFADYEVVEVIHERVGDLIPPTEPDGPTDVA